MADVLCVGRELELARLHRHLQAAEHGTGALVLVEGPAGVGKSTLAAWCTDVARRAGGSVHQVVALGPDLELPVGIWARLAAAVVAGGGRVPPVLLDGAVEQLHPHGRYGAVLELLGALGPRPAVLVLDDLHSADESSLALLAQLGPALAAAGVLIIATSRGPAAHPTTGGRDALEALEPWATTIALGGLDGAGVRALTLAVAGPSAAEWARSVQPVLTERSGGNPLVLQVILDDLGVADGARPSADEVAALPRNAAVGDVLARRLASLPASSHELLHAIALMGGTVAPEAIEAVVRRDVVTDIDRVVAAGALEVRADGSLAFVHPAVAESVVAREPRGAVVLHCRIAEWLRARGRPSDLPAIANHLAAAREQVPPTELADAAGAAAAQALRVGDHAAAARAFDLVLSTGTLIDQVDVLLQASAAHHVAGHRDEGWERAWRAADLCTEARPADLARAALSFALARDYSVDTAPAVALLRRALEALDHDHVLRREVLASLSVLEMSLPIRVDLQPFPRAAEGHVHDPSAPIAWHWITRPEVARPLADEALELARATDDPELIARVAMAWRQSYCAPEWLADRLAATEHARTHARTPQDRVLAMIASALDNLEAGRRNEVDDSCAGLEELGQTTGDPEVRWRSAQLGAMLALASGLPDVAERRSVEAFAHGSQAGENGRWVVRSIQAAMAALEADDDPGPTIDFLAANIDELAYPPMRAGVVWALVEGGRLAEAQRYLSDLVAHVVDDPGRESSWLLTGAFTADAVAAFEDVSLAARLVPVLMPFADRIAVDGLGIYCHGCLARPVSRLSRLTGGLDEARSLARLGRDRDSACGLTRFALDGTIDLLGLDPDPVVAQAVLDDATKAGLTRTARRARALLPLDAASELTARQREVLRALAEGLTYQAAGDRLGFSHSTIRHEAMRVYAALGATDRDDAVRIAQARGLLSGGDA